MPPEGTVAGVESESRVITIKGHQFNVSAPYAEGHTLTKAEASALNQLRGENLRNNFATEVEKAKEKAKAESGSEDLSDEVIATLQTSLNDYDAKYEFRGKGAARAPVDPVLREATKLARILLAEALEKKGRKLKDLSDENQDELIAQILSKRPDITAQAKARIDSVKALAATAIDLD